MIQLLRAALEFLLDIIFPQYCCTCGSFGKYLCNECQYLVDFHFVPIKLPSNSSLNSVHAAFTMSGPIADLIHVMKYKYVKGIATMFGKILYLHTSFPDADVITFVPISPEKKRVRGFNQAEHIAQSLSLLTKIPCHELLIRTDHSVTGQAKISSKQERLKTTKQQHFFWKKFARPPNSVIIVDDVFTTGTTLTSCAEILKEHGVQRVHGLVIAHGKWYNIDLHGDVLIWRDALINICRRSLISEQNIDQNTTATKQAAKAVDGFYTTLTTVKTSAQAMFSAPTYATLAA